MKRFWGLALAMVLVCRLCPVAQAASGTCGENLQWSLNEATGELSITGTGPMANYTNNNRPPWRNCRDKVQTVTIGDGVTSIGVNAFNGCTSLAHLTLGAGVVSIGDYAFSRTALTQVTIPSTASEVSYNAFYNCPLSAITVDPRNTSYRSVDGVWFNRDITVLLSYPPQKKRLLLCDPGQRHQAGL